MYKISLITKGQSEYYWKNGMGKNGKENNFYPFDQPKKKKHQLFFLTPEHNHFRIDFHG